MTHNCKHEVDLAKMQLDIEYIRKSIEGNGKPGILSQVTANTKFRYVMIGGMTLLVSIAGYVKFK